MPDLKQLIESQLVAPIELHPRGDGEIQIEVPFYFADGDGYVLHLVRRGSAYELTDKAHTFQHLAYHIDITRLRDRTRGAIFEQILLRHGIEDRDGELVRVITDPTSIPEAVFSFVQALIHITDLRFLERETVKSTFRDDLSTAIRSAFTTPIKAWHDRERDPEGNHRVDWVINGVARPLGIFGLTNDTSALQAIIAARQIRSWGHTMLFVAIAEDQKELQRRTVAIASDTFDKQFSALRGNETAVRDYLHAEHEISRRLTAASSLPTRGDVD